MDIFKIKEAYLFLQTRLAFVHDAVIVAQRALENTLKRNDSLFHQNFRHGELYNRGLPGIYCHPGTDKNNPQRPFGTFEHGKTISKSLHNIKLSSSDHTLTGIIEFDRNGLRKNFYVSVIDLVSNSKSAFNKKEVGFASFEDLCDHKFTGFFMASK